MSRVSLYLNFMGRTEEAFTFYASVFGTQLSTINRMGDVPPAPGQPAWSDAEKDLVMHVELPIMGGLVLMATDMLESMGHHLEVGNNISINLEPDTFAEGERMFNALAEGASDVTPLMPMFWGATWGACLDRFGIRWMVNCPNPA
jgi:PhnB protein